MKLTEMAFRGDSITVFDLDDTLIVTSARIAVRDSITGEVFYLTPQEFNEYEHQPHHSVNYSQFEDPQILKAGKLVEDILNTLKSTYENQTAVAIVTARNKGEMIREFFLEHGIDIHPKFVIAVNDPAEGFTGTVAEKKQQAFKRLYEMGYRNFKFFDDDHANLRLAKDLESELPISVETHRVPAEALPKLDITTIGIFSGKFKPPHKGHYESILKIADENDETHVFVSPKEEGLVTGKMAVQILQIYFKDRQDIEIHLADVTPVRSAYEWVEDLGLTSEAPNCQINLYALKEDMVRFAGMEKWLGGIKRLNRVPTERPEFISGAAHDRSGDTDGVSGTLMRKFLAEDDIESFKKGLPDGINADQIWSILKSTNESLETDMPGKFAVPAASFEPSQDPNISPTLTNTQVGGVPSHWTTTQPYSRFDLKTNPFQDRYGSNPRSKVIKSFDDFIKSGQTSGDDPNKLDQSLNSESNK